MSIVCAAAGIVADAGDLAVGDRNVRRNDLAAEDIDDLAAGEQKIGWLVAERDPDPPCPGLFIECRLCAEPSAVRHPASCDPNEVST